VPLDNNASERSLRRVALVARALFVGDVDAGMSIAWERRRAGGERIGRGGRRRTATRRATTSTCQSAARDQRERRRAHERAVLGQLRRESVDHARMQYALIAGRWSRVRAVLWLLPLLVATAHADQRPSSTTNFAETARFLAGKGVAPDSSLAEHARTQSYAEYAEQIESAWKQYQQQNLERMQTWWAGRGPAKYSTVFYPFSGPDIGNALAFFPDADSYLMFGLESPGASPDLQAMDQEAIDAGLTELKASLSTILQVNYFFTKAMEKKLGNGSFNSISGLLLFFLAMSDCEVTAVRRIAIDEGGALVPGTAADDSTAARFRTRIPGIEISFRHGSKQQTLRYFMVNAEDAHLAKSSSDFIPYLKSQGRFATMIKSASYLMHKDGIEEPAHFEQIRSLILSQSDFIVQDDSGVPLRLFARDRWNVQFHGQYEAPTQEFGKYLQKDLRVEMQRNSTGKLPFSYGYAYKQGESNLMTAVRAQ
jgi:hypothetical protein